MFKEEFTINFTALLEKYGKIQIENPKMSKSAGKFKFPE